MHQGKLLHATYDSIPSSTSIMSQQNCNIFVDIELMMSMPEVCYAFSISRALLR